MFKTRRSHRSKGVVTAQVLAVMAMGVPKSGHAALAHGAVAQADKRMHGFASTNAQIFLIMVNEGSAGLENET
jgi:hypothetical protein